MLFYGIFVADDYMLVICPGIANSSQSLYVCTCVDNAQNAGYRVAVLNHLGALPNVKLTAPRIFTYGKFTLLRNSWLQQGVTKVVVLSIVQDMGKMNLDK